MPLPNIFSKEVTNGLIERVQHLMPGTQPKWGVMNAAQMLAHVNVVYEMVLENKHPKPNVLMRLMLKTFVKRIVTSEKPYKQNIRTAPAMVISQERNFEAEKHRLITYLTKTQQLGESFFHNRKSHSFGKLTITEWNNMLYKHLDHHLQQFGV